LLRLPPGLRRAALSLAGKRSPWDPRFNPTAPDAGPELPVAPPDFVGVGVQKAGTTWWFSMIETHPRVYSHPRFHKERHYFDRFYQVPFTDEDVAGYHGWFPRPPGYVTGEWTPDYCCHDWIPSLLFRAAPEAKVLFMVRDPVERYRSGLSHHLGRGTKPTPTLASDAFQRGLYFEQIRRVERLFGADRVLVLQFEACIAEPLTHMRTTSDFLGLEPFTPQITRTDQGHSSKRYDLPPGRRDELSALYKADVEALASRYPQLDLDLWPNFAGRS
jgi:hypothetical protein